MEPVEACGPPAFLRAFSPSVIKAKNPDQREILHLISTASTDRAGDVVDPGGADVRNYMRNPVVLADHSYSIEKIIGKAVEINVTKEGIYARTRFRTTPLGEAAYQLASEGIGGWSIGFRPYDGGWEMIRDPESNEVKGFRFMKWELLEYSSVAIPMNQDVVNEAIKRGLPPEMVPVFFLPQPPPPVSAASPCSYAKASALTPPLHRAINKTRMRIALLDLSAQLKAAENMINGTE